MIHGVQILQPKNYYLIHLNIDTAKEMENRRYGKIQYTTLYLVVFGNTKYLHNDFS